MHADGTPSIDQTRPKSHPGLEVRIGAAFPGFDIRRSLDVITHADVVLSGIPNLVAHTVEPHHFAAVLVIGPGRAVGPIKGLNGGFVEEVSSLRFDVIGQPVRQPVAAIQKGISRHGSGIQESCSHRGHAGPEHIQTLQPHGFGQIGEGFVSPPILEGQGALLGNGEITIHGRSGTRFQIGALLPVRENLRELLDRFRIEVSSNASPHHHRVIRGGRIELPSVELAHVKPGAVGARLVRLAFFDENADPLPDSDALALNRIGDRVSDGLGGCLRR